MACAYRDGSARAHQTRLGYPQAVEQALVAAPVTTDANGEVEVHLLAQHPLQFAPGSCADCLDHAPVRTDQDPLLRGAFDPDQRSHPRQPGTGLLDLLDDHLDGVRDLLKGALDHSLAHELRQQDGLGLVGGRLLAEHERSFRHACREMLEQRRYATARTRRDREQLIGDLECGGFLERRRRRPAREPVDLVQRDRHGNVSPCERRRDVAVARSDALLPVEHQQGDVRVGQLLPHTCSHPRRELVARALHTRQVHQHELAITVRANPPNRPSCRLRAIGDDRHLVSDKGVDQLRLAYVRSPGQRNESTVRQAGPCASNSRCTSSISPSSVSWSIPIRWSTPCTIASATSTVCPRQITTSPSSRAPWPGPVSSTGKESTSVGPRRCRWRTLRLARRRWSTNSIARWPSSIPPEPAARAHSRRTSSGEGTRPLAASCSPTRISTSSMRSHARRSAERSSGASRWACTS